MPSTLRYNRKAIIFSLLSIFLIFYLLLSDSSSSGQSFRTNTELALARARNQKGYQDTKTPLQENLSDEDQTRKANEKLQSILDLKNNNDPKSTHKPATEVSVEKEFGKPIRKEDTPKEDSKDKSKSPTHSEKISHDAEDSSTADKKKPTDSKLSTGADGSEKSMKTIPSSGSGSDASEKAKDTTEQDDPARDFARNKLMEYLKNPVVIFSKSYCPHSKRAKHLLQEIYSITPKPLVVELDQLSGSVPSTDRNLGQVMQEVLGGMTGRKTVPNIMVGGVHSIGGNDKIWDMHEKGLLAEEIRKLGGRKVTEVDVAAEE